MDKVIFSIIDKDTFEVGNCTYYMMEDSLFYTVKQIILSKKELSLLFREFLRTYPDDAITETETSTEVLVTFFDIDYDRMMEIINASSEYQKKSATMVNPIMENTVIEKKINKRKKITRKNNFRRAVATVSAAVLLGMTGLLTYKIDSKRNTSPPRASTMISDSMINSNDLTKGLKILKDEDEAVIVVNDEDNENYLSEDNTNSVLPVLPNNLTNNEKNTDIALEERIDAVMRISAEDWIETDKYFIANAYYSQAITKYANMYGIDPNLALAIGTHERGTHSDTVDADGAIGLFQIQVRGGWNWSGETIKAYNFETNQYDSMVITEESVSDVFENIKVGCMMIQELLIKYNYNVAEAVMAYNYGENYLSDVLEFCSNETGFSISELNSMDNLEWLNYRNCISGGDAQYLENVCKFIPNGTILNFKKINGENYTVKYENMTPQKNNHL